MRWQIARHSALSRNSKVVIGELGQMPGILHSNTNAHKGILRGQGPHHYKSKMSPKTALIKVHVAPKGEGLLNI
jgi:hypothetical protein